MNKEEKKEQGRYVYCVVDSDKPIKFGNIGIENNEVYTIPYNKLCAVVHNCEAPYKSDKDEEVKEWIKAHQNVIDRVAKELGTVIPLSFDVIVKGETKDNVLIWLKEEYESLQKKIEKVKNKQEFGIQIFWDKELLKDKIMSNEIIKIKTEKNKMSKGRAYFYEQKIKDLFKKEMEKKADFYFKKFYAQIKEYADDIKVEKIKSKDMLMNISCLTKKNKVKEIGIELERINKLQGFSVRFTGPWPPYSFVSPG